MPLITLRAAKGSDLTPTEADTNFKWPVTQKTTTYSCLVSDNRTVIECNSATPFTITLGVAATMNASDTGDYESMITNIGTGAVTVARAGTDTIDGAVTSLVLPQYTAVILKTNSAGTGYGTKADGNANRKALTYSNANTFSGPNSHSGVESFTGQVVVSPPVSAGGFSAYTVASGITAYVTGATYAFMPHANSTGSSNVNFNGLGVRNIYIDDSGNPVIAGDIQTGKIALLYYNGANFILTNPQLSLASNSTVGVGVGAAKLKLNGGTGAGVGASINFNRGSVFKTFIGHEAALYGTDSANLVLYTDAVGDAIKLLPNGASVIYSVVSTAGTANAGTVTLGETAYVTDRIYEAKITISNTGACTMAFDGLVARSVKLIDGSDPLAGQQKAGMVAKWLCTATTLVLLNPYKPPFRGCLANKTTNQVLTTGVNNIITLNTEIYDTDAIHDTATNTERLTVPAGVTVVRLGAFVIYASAATAAYRYTALLKNNSVVTGLPSDIRYPAGGGLQTYANLQSADIQVTAGDYFHITMNHDFGSNLNCEAGTWLSMTIVQ